MLIKRCLIFAFVFSLIAGCGDSSDNKASVTPSSTTSSQVDSVDIKANTAESKTQANSEPVATVPITAQKPINEAELGKRYAGKELKVIDVSEIQVNGVSTLSVTFSVPLKANQKFADKLHLIDTISGKVDGGWVLSKNQQELTLSHLEPKRKLVLTIDAGIEAVNGEELAKEYVSRFETKDLQAMLGFASRGSLFPVRLAEGLPVLTLNVDKVTVDFFRVKTDMLPQFLNDWGRGGSLQYWQAEDLLKKADLVYTGGFNLNPDKNTRETVLLPITGVKPLQEAGVYFAVMRQSGAYKYSNPATVFTVTDIGLSAHRYKANDKLVVFAQALEGGKSLADVMIQVFDAKGKVIAEGKTDDKGHAEIVNVAKAEMVLASKDGQTTMLRLKSSALDLSEFAVTGPNDTALQFFIFGPRDLYRPGETVLFNALLRDKDGRLVTDMPVNVEVRRPDGALVRSFVWKAEKQGFYQYNLATSTDSPTGRWSLLVKVGKDKVQDYSFNIEDFLPERLALELKGSEQPLLPIDSVLIQVTGRYLYGAPASGNLLSGQAYVRPQREAVASLPGYYFGAITEKGLSQDVDIREFALDNDGKGTININSQWQEVRSPIQLIVQASLQESGGRPIVRRVVQPIWPAQQLAGIRPLFKDREIDEGSTAEFEIVMADAAGNKLAAKDLKVRFIHERRDYYWYYSDSDGWNSNYSQKDLTLDEQVVSINKDSTVKVSYPVDWGYYRLEVENPANGLISSTEFRAGYSWQENTEQGGDIRPDQVKITLDKPSYKNGDTAKITVTPPSAGNGYLMIESSDGLLWWQPIDITAAGKTFEIPVNDKWQRHDLYISTLVVRPGERKAGATPKRAVGILHLPLERKERQLALTLTAPEKMRPSQNLTVKIQARDATGGIPKQVNVLVAAVDVGILNITSFKTPDPFSTFFGRKAYGVDQLDVYGQLIEAGQGRLASLSFGGDATLAAGGKRPDTSIMIVALQSKPVTLNDKGEGEVQLAIPDFNGELRLMAQAWTDDSFGVAETKVIVAAPIVAELSTPRFLAGGDSSALALDITNLTEQSQKLTVKVNAEGLIKLVNTTALQVALGKGQRSTITIPVEALPGMGTGKVSIEVDGVNIPGETIAPLKREWSIGTRAAYPAKLETFQSVLESSPWNIPTAAMVNLEESGREGLIQLTSQPPLNLATQIEWLYAYPYGCAEQTTSGLYPSLYTNTDMLKRLGVKTKQSDEQRRTAIETGIGRLLGMQRYNGSFGSWSNDGYEENWLTVYVTDFLLRARERGYSVPDEALQKSVNRLLAYLQNSNTIEPNSTDSLVKSRFAVQAYAGYVLARSKQAPLGSLRALYDRRSQAPSGLSLVQLSVALKLMGDNPRAAQALKEGLVKQRDNPAKYWWIGDYGSDVRDDALILAILQEEQLLPTEVLNRLFTLSQQIAAKGWLSTQERNALFLAGYRLAAVPEKPWQAEVDVAGNTYSLSDKKPNLKFSDEEMKQITDLKVTNKTPSVALYQTVNLSGYPTAVPKATSHDGLSISKEYLDLSGRPIDLTRVKSGDLIIVRLHVYATRRIPDALVVDLLPAGLELENQNLAQSSASLKDASANIKDALKSMRNARIAHQEFRDDRYVVQLDLGYNYSAQKVDLLYLARAVTPGQYLVPPAMVESMYRPNWQATSEAPNVLVVKPH